MKRNLPAGAFALLAIALVTAGCAGSGQLTVEDRSRSFEHPPEQVYNATLGYLTEAGYEVAHASPDDLAITSEHRRGHETDTNSRDRISALISPRYGGGSTLTLTLSEERLTDAQWVPVTGMRASDVIPRYALHLDAIAALVPAHDATIRPEIEEEPAEEEPIAAPEENQAVVVVVVPPPGRERVRWAQERLNDSGYSCGTADGILGRNTNLCLRAFQRASGLEETGAVDDETVQAIAELGTKR